MNDKKLSYDEIENLKWFTQKSSEMIMSCPKIDPQIAEIVEKHHENSKGTGFPRGLGARSVGPLSATFNVGHQIVQELYEYQYDEKALPRIMDSMKLHFDDGNYKTSLSAFEKVFRHI